MMWTFGLTRIQEPTFTSPASQGRFTLRAKRSLEFAAPAPPPASLRLSVPRALRNRATTLFSISFAAVSTRHPAIPHHPNYLQVILDIRYQYAIMVTSIWHDSFVPCKPCAPATRSFHPYRDLHVCPSCFLANSSRPKFPDLPSLFSIDYTLFHFPYPVSPLLTPALRMGVSPSLR